LLAMYLLMSALYLLYYYHNRLKSTRQMGRLTIYRTDKRNFVFFQIWLLIIAITGILTEIYNNSNRYYIWIFAVLFILSLSSVIQQIYFTEKKITVKMQDLPSKKVMFSIMLCLTLFLLYDIDYMALSVWGFAIAFPILCRYFSLSINTEFLESWQENSPFNAVYIFIIRAVRHFGRFIRLFIDRLLIEKIIFNVIMFLSRIFIGLFRHIHNKRIGGIFTVMVVLSLLLWLSFNKGGL